MNALEDRGLFWSSATQDVIEDHIPTTAAPGSLTIGDKGQIELDLDTILDVGFERDRHLGDARLPSSTLIYGILKKKGRKVVLSGGFRNGHVISSFFPENEKYVCDNAIVAYSDTHTFPSEIRISEIHVSLSGFEEWVNSKSIDVSLKENGSYLASYEPDPVLEFDIEDGTLQIYSSIPSTFEGRGNSAEFRHQASIDMVFRRPVTAAEAGIFWTQLRDFLILLTDAERSLKHPLVKLSGKKYWAEFYGFDVQGGEVEPSDLKCAVRFIDAKPHFGSLFQQWRSQRDLYGPGFYLYLGVRRGNQMYVEHRFANMVWGLERLHRSKNPELPNQSLHNKIERILALITAPKDQRWARLMLSRSSEQPLSSRLFDLFSSLPLALDHTRIKSFSADLADRRNDVSHFGGPRSGVDQRLFLESMHRITAAVRFLYHAIILIDIGVDPFLVKSWLETRWISWQAQRLFEEVGLKEKQIVAPLTAPANIGEAI